MLRSRPRQSAQRAARRDALARASTVLLGLFVLCSWVACGGNGKSRRGTSDGAGTAASGAGTSGGGSQSQCGACQPGAHRCNEEYLLICDDDCSWALDDTCASAALCDDSAGRCRSCGAGETRCVGDAWQGCAADGTSWVTLEECLGPCTESGCDPCPIADELRCTALDPADPNSVATVLELCVSGVGWVNQDTCSSESVCRETVDETARESSVFTGACLAPVCEAGDRRCDPDNPTYLQACSETGVSWRVLIVCSGGQTCQASADGTPSCAG